MFGMRRPLGIAAILVVIAVLAGVLAATFGLAPLWRAATMARTISLGFFNLVNMPGRNFSLHQDDGGASPRTKSSGGSPGSTGQEQRALPACEAGREDACRLL